MAGTAKTTYLANKILNLVCRNTSYTPPANAYLALFTASPGESGSLTDEVAGGSYARQAITFGSAASSGAISNTVAVTFSGMPAATVTHVGICDAATAGNVLYYKALSSSVPIALNDDYTLPIGNITLTED